MNDVRLSERWKALTAHCAEIARLFEVSVVARRCIGTAARHDVHPLEWDFVAAAGARRQADFLNGRVCAHACLDELGAGNDPVAVGDKGVPVWPAGIIGSISHCDGFCAAVAVRKQRLRSIGIDIEERGRVGHDLEPLILRDSERRMLDAVSPTDRQDWPTLIFSAKEAFYKAQFPLTGEFLDFHDASVDVGHDSFSLKLERPVAKLGETGARFSGRYLFSDRHVLTGIIL